MLQRASRSPVDRKWDGESHDRTAGGSIGGPGPEAHGEDMKRTTGPFWCRAPEELLAESGSAPSGLTGAEAAERLARYGPNTLRPTRPPGAPPLPVPHFQ